jgi:MFS family permease
MQRPNHQMNPSVRRAPLLALLTANAISMTGNVAALVAIPWFVLKTTGSPALTGIAAFFNFLPTVVAGFLGGTLIDRVGYKKMSIVADVASGVTVALIPLLHSTVGLEFWQLITLVFFGALLDAPGTTARGAITPDVAHEAGWTLAAASGANQVVERSSRLLGAPLAGVLIAVLGPANVLWANAATFGVSALLVALAVPYQPGLNNDEKYVAQLREGFLFLLRSPLLRAVTFTVTITNFLDAIAAIALPVFANQVFGDSLSLGLLLGASGGGAVVGALIYARFGREVSRRTVFGCGFVGSVIWYPILALFPPLGVAVAAKAVSGLGAGPLNPIFDTLLYERVPSGMRGRVIGAVVGAAWVALPLGVLLGGVVIEAIGVRATIIATGALYLITTSTLWLNPAIKRMDEGSDIATEGEASSALVCT